MTDGGFLEYQHEAEYLPIRRLRVRHYVPWLAVRHVDYSSSGVVSQCRMQHGAPLIPFGTG